MLKVTPRSPRIISKFKLEIGECKLEKEILKFAICILK
jgi:hypothetical protein